MQALLLHDIHLQIHRNLHLRLNTEYDNLEGLIKLYNNQVFIADNIKEVIPEFLMLLKGVIDFIFFLSAFIWMLCP